jgi:hypothetical protein
LLCVSGLRRLGLHSGHPLQLHHTLDHAPPLPDVPGRPLLWQLRHGAAALSELERAIAQMGPQEVARRIRRKDYLDWVRYEHEVEYHLLLVLKGILAACQTRDPAAYEQAMRAYAAQVEAGLYNQKPLSCARCLRWRGSVAPGGAAPARRRPPAPPD